MTHIIKYILDRDTLFRHTSFMSNVTCSCGTVPQTSATSQPIDLRFRSVEALIVKVTKRCNLDCAYCYENIQKVGDMPIEVFKELAQKALSSTQKENVEFIFHGGEPTLMPDEWFAEAFQTCRELAEHNKKHATLSMQSNLWRLSTSQLALFKRNRVSLGASLDGPASLDAMRPGAGRAIKNFLHARAEGLRIGVLMTINHSNAHQFGEITQWLRHDLGVTHFKANVAYAVGAGLSLRDLAVEQIFGAKRAILDQMISQGEDAVFEHNLIQQIDWFVGNGRNHERTSLCNSKKCGAGSRVLGVTPEGELLPCGRFKWNDSDFVLGALADLQDESEIFHARSEAFHGQAPANWLNCANCSARSICGFGCQAFITRSNSRVNVECLPTQLLFNYMTERRDAIATLHRILVAKKLIGVDDYADERYGDGTHVPYTDIYNDKYSDN